MIPDLSDVSGEARRMYYRLRTRALNANTTTLTPEDFGACAPIDDSQFKPSVLELLEIGALVATEGGTRIVLRTQSQRRSKRISLHWAGAEGKQPLPDLSNLSTEARGLYHRLRACVLADRPSRNCSFAIVSQRNLRLCDAFGADGAWLTELFDARAMVVLRDDGVNITPHEESTPREETVFAVVLELPP